MSDVRKISDATMIIGMLENGQLAADLSADITTAIRTLQDHAGRGVAKGSVTLTLNFEVQEEKAEIAATIASKLPKPMRRKSFFFTTEDGALSVEHPRQHDFLPRDVSRRDSA